MLVKGGIGCWCKEALGAGERRHCVLVKGLGTHPPEHPCSDTPGSTAPEIGRRLESHGHRALEAELEWHRYRGSDRTTMGKAAREAPGSCFCRHIFHVKKLHLGHTAHCFALRQNPTLIGKSATKVRAAEGSRAVYADRKERRQGEKREVRCEGGERVQVGQRKQGYGMSSRV